ncbi:MAG: 50S ribosomal protein L5 [Phycisphaerae bacterium]|nr:50S ribosomal protein L5 [Phycisphaerae bacterium]
MVRLLEKYKSQIMPQLQEEFKCENPMALPRLDKVVVSMGVGKALEDKKLIDVAARDLGLITGQKAVICKAKKSVSNFKLREGYPIGCKVTLRGARMYEFMDRLMSVVIPRIRDFRGLNPKSFDGRGAYSMGLAEQSVFPEIDVANIEHQQGMNVTIVTTAKSDAEARRLLTLMGMPFRN